jgi:DNA-directed RNA polymerase III subunit RPC3
MYAQMAAEWEGGKELVAVVEVILQHGMLPKEDLLQAVVGRMEAENTFEDEDPKGKKRARAEEQRTFRSSPLLTSLPFALALLWSRSIAPLLCVSFLSLSSTVLNLRPAGYTAADKLVRRAFAKGYISIVTPGSQISPSSLEIKWEEELRLTIKGAWAALISLPSIFPLGASRGRCLLVLLSTGIPTTKDLQRVKLTLREKQEEWAEEERARAKGQVRRFLLLPAPSDQDDNWPF